MTKNVRTLQRNSSNVEKDPLLVRGTYHGLELLLPGGEPLLLQGYDLSVCNILGNVLLLTQEEHLCHAQEEDLLIAQAWHHHWKQMHYILRSQQNRLPMIDTLCSQ